MKNYLTNLKVVVIGLFLVTINLVGCSTEKEVENETSFNNVTKLKTKTPENAAFRKGTNAAKDSFVGSFYDASFEYGNSIETVVDGVTLIVEEVVVNSAVRARGYTVSEKDSNKFLYFVDVDRLDFKVTSVDIIANRTKVVDKINENTEYTTTDKFDFIKVIDDANVNPPVSEKFWGTEKSGCVTESVGSGCTQEFCNYTSFVFWIKVEKLVHIPAGAMSC